MEVLEEDFQIKLKESDEVKIIGITPNNDLFYFKN